MSPSAVRALVRACAALALSACAAARPSSPPAAASSRGPDLVAGDTAALLAPGVIATGDVFAASLAPDGRTIYFTKATRDRTRMRVMRARLVDGRWAAPEALPFADVAPRAMDPFVSPDGRRLYFTASRRLEAARGQPQDDWDTWVVDLAPDGGVGAPRNLGAPANSERSEMYPGVTRDGTLYYQVWMPDSLARGVRGIWRLVPGAAAPERLEGPINDGDFPGNPYVTPDGRLLLFTADRPGGRGRGDLWASARTTDGRWDTPRNLGPLVNGPDVEFCPSLSPDGRYLLFSRIGYQGEERVRDDVYAVRVDAVPVLRALMQGAR
jgi:Tol biopolymer transport system component